MNGARSRHRGRSPLPELSSHGHERQADRLLQAAERAALSGDRSGDASRDASRARRGWASFPSQTLTSGTLRLDPPGIAIDVGAVVG